MVRPAVVLTFLALRAAGVGAQSPTERVHLDRLRDSLTHITDTVGIRGLWRSLHGLASRQRGDPLLPLRAGLVALRAAELGADPGANAALRELRAAADRRPDWPYPWYALALAETQRSASETSDPLELGSRVGIGSLERAVAHYRHALEGDPGFVPAAVALAALTLSLRDTSLIGASRDALRHCAASPARPSPELLLAWGRLERASEEVDSALVAFQEFLDGGGSRGVGLLELARTHLAFDVGGGEPAYYEGAADNEPASVAGYRGDLSPLATEAELATFDRRRGSGRVEFLRRFWTGRDRLDLRADGERLREHYRRLHVARRRFALTVSRRFYGRNDAYRSGSMDLDDRGVIYLRHGKPAERLRPFVFGLMPNESWKYRLADGDLLLHFSAGWDQHGGGDLYDYRLVESVLDLHGASDAPIDQLLLSRQSLSPLYARMLTWGPYGAARSRGQERGIGAASIAYGTGTDTYQLEFARPLTVFASVVAVGAGEEGTLVHLVFAVGEPGASPVLEDGMPVYSIRARFAAFDGLDQAVGQVDTTLVFRPGRVLEPGRYLVGRAELTVPPGLWRWRAAVEDAARSGVVLAGDTVRVTPAGPAFGLSDLALGESGASAVWRPTPADTVYLTPFDLFREGGEAELYYEVSGAVAGETYSHRIAVFRMKGERAERRPVVTLAVEEPAAAPVVRAHRTLQLTRLKAGRYLIDVRVTPPDGSAVTRRRGLTVAKTPTR